jgi:hypothetical protein
VVVQAKNAQKTLKVKSKKTPVPLPKKRGLFQACQGKRKVKKLQKAEKVQLNDSHI